MWTRYFFRPLWQNVLFVSDFTRQLLHCTVAGCADLPAMSDAQVRRPSDGTATIVCRDSGETRNLVCRDTAWVGDLSNCTKPAPTQRAWFSLCALRMDSGIPTTIGLPRDGDRTPNVTDLNKSNPDTHTHTHTYTELHKLADAKHKRIIWSARDSRERQQFPRLPQQLPFPFQYRCIVGVVEGVETFLSVAYPAAPPDSEFPSEFLQKKCTVNDAWLQFRDTTAVRTLFP